MTIQDILSIRDPVIQEYMQKQRLVMYKSHIDVDSVYSQATILARKYMEFANKCIAEKQLITVIIGISMKIVSDHISSEDIANIRKVTKMTPKQYRYWEFAFVRELGFQLYDLE